MPYKFVCPNCAKAMAAEDDWAGTRRPCPFCGEEVLIRRDRRLQQLGDRTLSPPAPAPAAADPRPAPERPAPAPPPPAPEPANRGASASLLIPLASPPPPAAAPPPSACPRCRQPWAEAAVICTNCGFDRRTGTCLGTERDLPSSPMATTESGHGTSDDATEARKEFRNLGFTVGILGMLTLLFLGGAKHDMVPVALLAIAGCVLTGTWLVAKPSLPAGLAAGLALLLLGGVDLVLVQKSGGLGFIAPLIDLGFAVKVFSGCAKFARS